MQRSARADPARRAVRRGGIDPRRSLAAVALGRPDVGRLCDGPVAGCREQSGLNAFITIDADAVLEDARRADLARVAGATLAPFHGVPMAIKDNINTRRLPTSGGTAALKQNRPARDAASSNDCKWPAPLCWARPICMNWRWAGPATILRSARPEILTLQAGWPAQQRGKRGGGRRAHGAGRDRHRYQRLNPHPGLVLRRRRPAAIARTLSDGRNCSACPFAGYDWADGSHG